MSLDAAGPSPLWRVLHDALCAGGEEMYAVHERHPAVVERLIEAVQPYVVGGLDRDAVTASSPSELLAEFHRRPGVELTAPEAPTLDVPGLDQRQGFVEEEVRELGEALAANDLISFADALADITYVVYGTAWRSGIPLDAVVREVHRSNMTKTATPGDGKAIKGPDYSPPDIASVLALSPDPITT